MAVLVDVDMRSQSKSRAMFGGGCGRAVRVLDPLLGLTQAWGFASFACISQFCSSYHISITKSRHGRRGLDTAYFLERESMLY